MDPPRAPLALLEVSPPGQDPVFPQFCPHPAAPRSHSLNPVPVGSRGSPVCSSGPLSVPLGASLHHFSNLFLQVLQVMETPSNSRLEQLTARIPRDVRAELRGKCPSPSLFPAVPSAGAGTRLEHPQIPELGLESWDNPFQSRSFVFPTVFPAGGNVLLPSGVCLGIFIERIRSLPLARHNPSCAGLLPNPAFPAPLPSQPLLGCSFPCPHPTPGDQSWGWHFHFRAPGVPSGGLWAPGRVDLGEERDKIRAGATHPL